MQPGPGLHSILAKNPYRIEINVVLPGIVPCQIKSHLPGFVGGVLIDKGSVRDNNCIGKHTGRKECQKSNA
jgi:hypothetical protein